MRRRLTLTMIGLVATALVLVGLVTLLLTVRSTRQDTRRELVRQAQGLAQAVNDEAVAANRSASRTAKPGQPLKSLINVLRSPLRLEGDAVVAVRPDGSVFDVNTPFQAPVLPSPLAVADINPVDLLAGRTISGTKGPIVYAAAPFRAEVVVAGRSVPDLTQVVILTRRPPTGLRAAGTWFLVASGVTLAAAALAAIRLGRRITRPLVAAEATTRQIASGDLTARVPVAPRGDPETASLAQSINTMAESLSRSRGLERQLLMSVSHDLRTPLTSIRGFAEAIADGAAPDTQRAAEIIASESRRLERLVRDLLQLAKLDARQFSFDLRAVDLSEVVADTGEGFRPAADDLGIRLTIAPVTGGTVGVTADRDRVAQVVANLVENALKYARSEVRLGAAVSAGQGVFWVEDDGPGIAGQDLPRVFDRLFMSSRYPARQLGSGLGLAIVSELVHAMGGAVRAESPVFDDGGTRMVVTLHSSSEVTVPATSLSPV